MQRPLDRSLGVLQHDHAVVGVRALREAVLPVAPAAQHHEQLVRERLRLPKPRLEVHRDDHLQLLVVVALHGAGAHQLVWRRLDRVCALGLHGERHLLDDTREVDALARHPRPPVLLPRGVAGRGGVAKAEHEGVSAVREHGLCGHPA